MSTNTTTHAVAIESSVLERWIGKVSHFSQLLKQVGKPKPNQNRAACAKALERVMRMREECQSIRQRNEELTKALADFKQRQTLIRLSR